LATSGCHAEIDALKSICTSSTDSDIKVFHRVTIYFYIMNAYLDFAHLESRAINSTTYAGDNSFGPFLELPGRATFDFTLIFEETILSIAPSALFLVLIPPRILHLWKTPRKVTGSYLQTAKIVSFLVHPSRYVLTNSRVFLPFSVSCMSPM
jgi:hypothetical protein